MTNYDFSTLSPTDFEKLVCDLMNAYFINKNLGGTFKSFKPGRDKGIDILLSTPENDFKIIGQVKHYNKSKYANLKYDLKNTEKEKIFKLNPTSYLVITSLELSPQNKLEIKEIFAPYILSIDHIFGREDLNSILNQNKNIEERHYKLWFSSTIILNKILNHKFQSRRKEFSEKNLKRKFRIFVITNDFHKAKLILNENKFIILTGEPGVGKSTLSEMIIYDYLKNDYQLNIVYDNIKEIENVLIDDESKQLFYFDDFLGHTQEEINKSKSAEASLIKIISQIENSENKYLILNTRKFILTSFMQGSERLRHFDPLRSETKIELRTYSYSIKRKILDNHIYDSELEKKQKDIIRILAHDICVNDNFTPRIVEFFTNSDRVNLEPQDLKKFIINNLKDPKEIWNHAYMKQITQFDRFLLNTLYSLNGETDIKHLEKAYNARINFEVEKNNYIKPQNPYYESLKLMNDGFIIISNNKPKYINFINPSLEDFLKYRINVNRQEVERILFSSKYIEQWYFFYSPYIKPKDAIEKNISCFFLNNYKELLENSLDINYDKFLISIFIQYFFENGLEENINNLKSINDWNFLNRNESALFYSKKLLNYSKSINKLNKTICDFNSQFFYILLTNEENLENLIELLNIFIRHFNKNIFNLFKNELELYDYFLDHLEAVFSDYIESNYYFLKNQNIEKDANYEIIDKIEKYIEFITLNINESFEIEYRFMLRQDWNDIALINSIENVQRQSKLVIDYDSIADEMMMNNFEDNEYRDYSKITLDDIINGKVLPIKDDSFKENKITDTDDKLFNADDDLPF
ncbi:restriction endonuclease [Winogradskyella litoriviva]|uniref:Restriction endonuclease n=1 Tax=Winogradskyella litoriviva TaxID=1220182 RepID=A0ABX2E5C4_9FLAO|nr:restriction endonuclease [Winogradskyella litoriviva]NRD23470.1 restriction endonuclease [Winogradskyella litoriviva]